MNKKYFVCCEECFQNIAKTNTGAARLWMDLCAVDCQYGIHSLKSNEDPSLRILEHSGYVLTTDREDHIKIHLIGRMETEEGEPFFCSKEGIHDRV